MPSKKTEITETEQTELTEAEADKLREYLQAAEDLQKKNPMPRMNVTNPDDNPPDLWDQVNEWAAIWKELNDQYRPLLDKAVEIGLDRLAEETGATSFDLMRLALPEKKDEAARKLHTQLATFSRFGLMDDNVNRSMIKEAPQTGMLEDQLTFVWTVNQAPQGKRPVQTKISISSTNDDIYTSRKIIGYDEDVFNTACNAIFDTMQAGIAFPFYITPEELWRRMNGITDVRITPSKLQKKKFCDSLDKMRFTRLIMNVRAEEKAKYKLPEDDRIKGGIFDGYYLKAERATFYTEKGNLIEGYVFDELPFLYEYNQAKGHLVLVDSSLLDTSDALKKEMKYTNEFKFYLLREIQLMYDHKRNSNRILYQTIYDAAGIPSPKDRLEENKYKSHNSYLSGIRNESTNDRKVISSLLESWKRRKWILDYKQVKGGKGYIGIDIKLNPKNYTEIDETKAIEGK